MSSPARPRRRRTRETRFVASAGVLLGAALSGCGMIVGIEAIAYRDPPVGVAAPPDATVEAGAPLESGDASRGFDCSGATFCDSFERNDPRGEWSGVEVSGGAELACVVDRARSGSSSLRSTLRELEGSAAYVEAVVGPAKRLRFAFSFFVGPLPERAVRLGTVGFSPAAVRSVEERLVPRLIGGNVVFDLVSFEDGSLSSARLASLPFAPGRWTDVDVWFDLTQSTPQISLAVDRVVVDVASPRPLEGASVRITAGAASDETGPAVYIDTDDVRVDLEW